MYIQGLVPAGRRLIPWNVPTVHQILTAKWIQNTVKPSDYLGEHPSTAYKACKRDCRVVLGKADTMRPYTYTPLPMTSSSSSTKVIVPTNESNDHTALKKAEGLVTVASFQFFDTLLMNMASKPIFLPTRMNVALATHILE